MEKMMEKAKEELETLEKLHPNRFDYLKLELKSFISVLQSQQLELFDPLPTSSATTQASTSMKRKRACLKRRKEEEECERKGFEYHHNHDINDNNNNNDNYYHKKVMRQRDRVDVVLEKAQACLRKIKDVKISLKC